MVGFAVWLLSAVVCTSALVFMPAPMGPSIDDRWCNGLLPFPNLSVAGGPSIMVRSILRTRYDVFCLLQPTR